MAWTDERVEQLKQLWSEGLSASQIANKMGGVTRNAVIGKVHRLGLSGRATPAKPQLKSRLERPRMSAERPSRTEVQEESPAASSLPEPEFLEPLILDTGDKATVGTLKNNMCRWPVGDPSSDDFHFCGQAASGNKPYCAYHAHMAFQPSSTKRETAKPAREIAAPRRAAG